MHNFENSTAPLNLIKVRPMDWYYRLSVYRWIDGHLSDKVLSSNVDIIDQNFKIFNWWIDNINENKTVTIVLIDTIGGDPAIHTIGIDPATWVVLQVYKSAF